MDIENYNVRCFYEQKIDNSLVDGKECSSFYLTARSVVESR